jgi:hypothetical protein
MTAAYDKNPLKILGAALQSPLALAVCTALLWLGTRALAMAPADALLSGGMTPLAFFKLPIPLFFLSSSLLWIAIFRSAGLLAFLFFALALGVMRGGASAFVRDRDPSALVLVAGELTLLIIALPAASPAASGAGSFAAAGIALLFFIARCIELKLSPSS